MLGLSDLKDKKVFASWSSRLHTDEVGVGSGPARVVPTFFVFARAGKGNFSEPVKTNKVGLLSIRWSNPVQLQSSLLKAAVPENPLEKGKLGAMALKLTLRGC